MNIKYQLIIAIFVSILGLMGFSLMALLISEDKLIHFDETIIAFVQGFEAPFLTLIMKMFTYIGSSAFVMGVSLLIVIFLKIIVKHRIELIFFIAVLTGSGIINQILKLIFHRARPDLHRLIEESGYSFPSGHAMNAFTVYVTLTFLLWSHIPTRLGRTLIILFSCIFILMIGLSRIYLGVHYPSDIIGGYFASGCWVGGAIFFFQKYKERMFEKKMKKVI